MEYLTDLGVLMGNPNKLYIVFVNIIKADQGEITYSVDWG